MARGRNTHNPPRTVATRSMGNPANEDDSLVADPGAPPRVVHSPIVPNIPANDNEEVDNDLERTLQESSGHPFSDFASTVTAHVTTTSSSFMRNLFVPSLNSMATNSALSFGAHTASTNNANNDNNPPASHNRGFFWPIVTSSETQASRTSQANHNNDARIITMETQQAQLVRSVNELHRMHEAAATANAQFQQEMRQFTRTMHQSYSHLNNRVNDLHIRANGVTMANTSMPQVTNASIVTLPSSLMNNNHHTPRVTIHSSAFVQVMSTQTTQSHNHPLVTTCQANNHALFSQNLIPFNTHHVNGLHNGNGSPASDSWSRLLIPEPQPLVTANPNINLKSSDLPIPKYSGPNDHKTPFEFVLELEKYRAIKGLTEQQMLDHILPLALTQDAYNWHRYERPFVSWEDFTRRFRNDFQAVGYLDSIRKEMETRTQAPDEPLSAFIRVIRGYYERLGEPFHEREIVARVLRQMHPVYRQSLSTRDIRTLRDLKIAAQDAQELLKSFITYKPPPTTGALEPSLSWKQSSTFSSAESCKLHLASVDPFEYFHSQGNKNRQVSFADPPVASTTSASRPSYSPTVPSPRASPTNMRRSPTPIVCYECNEPGHVKRDCPKLKKTSGNASPPSPKRQ